MESTKYFKYSLVQINQNNRQLNIYLSYQPKDCNILNKSKNIVYSRQVSDISTRSMRMALNIER